jgi:hypothetical protein
VPHPTLLEREREVAALHEAADRASDGRGCLVLLEGPAGIGKTRLLRAIADEAAPDAGLRLLQARATEHEEHMPFGLVRQLFDAAVLDGSGRPREELFEGAARLALTVFDGSADTTADRYSQLNGLLWLLSGIGREGPLAVVADDVQWADEPSLEFLAFLARRVESLPVLLVAATRPAAESGRPLVRELLLDPQAQLLRPSALGRSSVDALVRDALGAPGADEFEEACLDATRGNPLLLKELLRDVRARDLAPTAAAAAEVGTFAPEGLTAVLDHRFGHMPPGARALAEAVAVLGDGQPAATVAEVAGLSRAVVEDVEAALVHGGVLEDRSGLCYTHPLVAGGRAARDPAEPSRGAAPGGRSGARSPRRRAGRAGRPPAARRARPRPRGRRDARAGGPAIGRCWALRAPPRPTSPARWPSRPRRAERWRLLADLGQAEARAGIGTPVQHLREAVALAPTPDAAAAASLELALALKFSGQTVEAVDILEAIPPDGVSSDLAELIALELLGLAYFSSSGRLRLGARLADLRDPGGVPSTPLEAFTLAALAFSTGAHGTGTAEQATELAARSMVGDLLPTDPIGPGYGLLIAGVATMWADDLDGAARINARLIDAGRRRGSVLARTERRRCSRSSRGVRAASPTSTPTARWPSTSTARRAARTRCHRPPAARARWRRSRVTPTPPSCARSRPRCRNPPIRTRCPTTWCCTPAASCACTSATSRPGRPNSWSAGA